MATRPSEKFPWPSQTSGLSTSYAPAKRMKKRVKRHCESSIAPRQIADISAFEDAQDQCQISSGNLISCFPTSGVIVPQHEWAGFVWNSRLPEITKIKSVNIYVFDAVALQPILHFPNVSNPSDRAGRITALVNDTWFGTEGLQWNGKNISRPFFWVIVPSNMMLDGSEIPQSTFTAVQTTILDSVSSSSVSNPGGIQSPSSASNVPHWAIAVMVVIGFLILVAGGILASVRHLRRRDGDFNRGLIGSALPMKLVTRPNSL